jgi:hypothetical protein
MVGEKASWWGRKAVVSMADWKVVKTDEKSVDQMA